MNNTRRNFMAILGLLMFFPGVVFGFLYVADQFAYILCGSTLGLHWEHVSADLVGTLFFMSVMSIFPFVGSTIP